MNRSSDRSKRRAAILAGVIGLAVLVVIIAIVASGGSDSGTPKKQPGEAVAGQNESKAMLAGIPQSGITLGDPKAKVTIVEFADLQCPYCKEFALQTLPLVVRDYVRTGKAKLEFRNLSFLGPDSVTAGKFAAGAAKQDKLWNFVDVFYYNQGPENSGYVTDQFLDKVASGVAGLDAAKARADGNATGQQALTAADTMAQQYGVSGTPTILVGKTGGKLTTVQGFTWDKVKPAIDKAVNGG